MNNGCARCRKRLVELRFKVTMTMLTGGLTTQAAAPSSLPARQALILKDADAPMPPMISQGITARIPKQDSLMMRLSYATAAMAKQSATHAERSAYIREGEPRAHAIGYHAIGVECRMRQDDAAVPYESRRCTYQVSRHAATHARELPRLLGKGL